MYSWLTRGILWLCCLLETLHESNTTRYFDVVVFFYLQNFARFLCHHCRLQLFLNNWFQLFKVKHKVIRIDLTLLNESTSNKFLAQVGIVYEIKRFIVKMLSCYMMVILKIILYYILIYSEIELLTFNY